MTTFGVLCVCTGNVCRSPVAERLLAAELAALGDRSFAVRSAGTRALVGDPVEASAAAELERRGGSAEGFAARQLDPSCLVGVDLVLAATRRHRSDVLELDPLLLTRTFTLNELAALLDPAAGASPAGRVADAARRRGSCPVAGDDLDLPDPIGQGPQVHVEVADRIAAAVAVVARGLLGLSAARS